MKFRSLNQIQIRKFKWIFWRFKFKWIKGIKSNLSKLMKFRSLNQTQIRRLKRHFKKFKFKWIKGLNKKMN